MGMEITQEELEKLDQEQNMTRIVAQQTNTEREEESPQSEKNIHVRLKTPRRAKKRSRFAIDTPEKVLEEARKRQEEENDVGNKNDLNGKKKTPPIKKSEKKQQVQKIILIVII